MAHKPQPFSVRLSAGLDARISALARRTRRSKAAVLQNLADEAERCRRYPGIAFRGDDWRRRPWVVGTGLDVWEIIEALEGFGGDADRMAGETELSAHQIGLATAYYAEFPEDVDAAIAENRSPLDELRRDYPFIHHRDRD